VSGRSLVAKRKHHAVRKGPWSWFKDGTQYRTRHGNLNGKALRWARKPASDAGAKKFVAEIIHAPKEKGLI